MSPFSALQLRGETAQQAPFQQRVNPQGPESEQDDLEPPGRRRLPPLACTEQGLGFRVSPFTCLCLASALLLIHMTNDFCNHALWL